MKTTLILTTTGAGLYLAPYLIIIILPLFLIGLKAAKTEF